MLVMLSIVLTASVIFPEISGETIIEILAGGALLAVLIYLLADGLLRRRGEVAT
ncbi:MAG: hypothetical protein ACHQAY_00260 [Hyphomicrobiales bacterium]